MSNKEILAAFLNKIREDVINDLRTKQISNSDLNMKVDVTEDGGELTGNDYWYYLVHGRKPGKQPPPQTIYDWIASKGITPDGISIKSLAFLIGRKIGKQGTDIFTGKRPGLALDAIIKSNGETFIRTLSDNYQLEFQDKFTQSLKEIFA